MTIQIGQIYCGQCSYFERLDRHFGACQFPLPKWAHASNKGNVVDIDEPAHDCRCFNNNRQLRVVEHKCNAIRNGSQCCLEMDHSGVHLYKCASKHCPGYTFPAFEMAHPKETCK